VSLYAPSAQLKHDVAPLALNVPVAQVRHAAEELAPAVGWYLPASHPRQEEKVVAYASEENVPGAQRVHEAAPCVLYDPNAQGRHASLEVLPLLALKKPAEHATQEASPRDVEGWYLPAAQNAQEGAPLPLNLPAAHGRHA